ncbi:MAG: NAD(P)-dependent oxidoreductase [Acidimicrobiales bacterium]
MRIAVLGMGRMGHAVAGRLVDGGHDVTVWNRSPGKADSIVSKGASKAQTPAGAAAGAEVVVTSLADDAAVLDVVRGEAADDSSGLLGAFEENSGSILVDMSTVSPETAEALAELAHGRSLASPILGAPGAVAAGEAVYLVSGPKPCHDAASQMFATLSERVQYLGEDVKSALQLKLLANYLLLSAVAVLGEIIPVAQAVGLPEDVLRGFLESSPLVAPALRNRLEALLSGKHEGWFTTTLGAKDTRLAEELAMRQGLRLPVADLVKRRYEEAAAAGYADADLTAVIELVRGQLAT